MRGAEKALNRPDRREGAATGAGAGSTSLDVLVVVSDSGFSSDGADDVATGTAATDCAVELFSLASPGRADSLELIDAAE